LIHIPETWYRTDYDVKQQKILIILTSRFRQGRKYPYRLSDCHRTHVELRTDVQQELSAIVLVFRAQPTTDLNNSLIHFCSVAAQPSLLGNYTGPRVISRAVHKGIH